jgi:RNA polymerase sigma-70 factor (ECF subfamily)
LATWNLLANISMNESPSFERLLKRVRAGDQDAATELVRTYESSIRRVVRLRLANAPLNALLDSTDICQSVMASFFVRVNLGQYTLDSPEQLIKLLATMARSKLAAQMRHEQAQRRDRRRTSHAADDQQFVGSTATPSREVAARDLLNHVQRHLSRDELELVGLRQQGADWAAVAERLGGSPDALRMKLGRAIDRVTRELGLDEDL